MSRAWLIEYKGALYQLISRGNERSDIFNNEVDRNGFLETIEEIAESCVIEVFPSLLISIHYDFLPRTQHADLTKAFHWFGTTDTQRFNWLDSLFKI